MTASSRFAESIVDNLLTVDVDAELRKVTSAQLQGPWQIATELIRIAIRGGAHSISVNCRRRCLEIQAQGFALDQHSIHLLAKLIDENFPIHQRHQALVELERNEKFALLALAGLDTQRIEIYSSSGEGIQLRVCEKSNVTVQAATSRLERLTSFTINFRKIQNSKIEWTIRESCRFCQIPIQFNGRPIEQGLSDVIIETSLQDPFAGILGIPYKGESSRIWLLQNGVVTTHVTLPHVPWFVAAVALEEQKSVSISGVELRESLQNKLSLLIEQSFHTLLSLGKRIAELPHEHILRILRFLLVAATQLDRINDIESLPIFPAIDRSGATHWFSLQQIRKRFEFDSQDRTLVSITPNCRILDYNITDIAFVLDEPVRTILFQGLQIRCQAPTKRHRTFFFGGPSLSAMFRKFSNVVNRTIRGIVAEWMTSSSTVLADNELLPEERRFTAALQRQMMHRHQIIWIEGDRPPRVGIWRICLSRNNPLVQTGIRAYMRDPSWIYPASIAITQELTGGVDARSRWLNLLPKIHNIP